MSQSPPTRVTELAANIRAEVARQRITQQAIAEALGLDQRAVSRRLLGHVEWSALHLVALSNLLGISMEQLVPSGDRTEAASA